MTIEQKLARLQIILGGNAPSEGTLLTEYLLMAKDEILNWLYRNIGGVPEDVDEVPTEYEQIQIMSCVAGYSLRGAEEQTVHSENGIRREFKYADMVDYIHAHIYPYIALGAK